MNRKGLVEECEGAPPLSGSVLSGTTPGESAPPLGVIPEEGLLFHWDDYFLFRGGSYFWIRRTSSSFRAIITAFRVWM